MDAPETGFPEKQRRRGVGNHIVNRDIAIREAKSEDAPQMARVHVASWQAAYRGILPDELLDNLAVETFQGSWEKHIANPQRTNLVLEVEGVVQGFAAFGHWREEGAPPETGELYALYLASEIWGSGCGGTLWKEAAARMRKTYSQVTVWVLRDNARARGFYESVGFGYDGQVADITLFGATVPEVRYRASL